MECGERIRACKPGLIAWSQPAGQVVRLVKDSDQILCFLKNSGSRVEKWIREPGVPSGQAFPPGLGGMPGG